MFFVVWAIVISNYMPYVVWVPHDTYGSWVCVVIFHVLLLLLLGSYINCVLTDPGTIPPAWHEQLEADSNFAANHRICNKTGVYRPLRSHYCSVTGRVVLNMDHFCPWVINTVGYYNRKFFVLFLFYTLLTTSFVVLTSTTTLIELQAPRRNGPLHLHHWSSGQVMCAFMALMLDCALAIMLLCFFSFHLRMVLLNETTIEGRAPLFNVGYRKNWEQVFGSEPLLWFIPVYGKGPVGDGVHWPSIRRADLLEEAAGNSDAATLLSPTYTSDSSFDE